ncbi:uncharacterized protein LOC144264917 [Eretmochelys imbricata]
MPAPCTRRSPTWSNAKRLHLLIIWGEEAVQAQVRSSRRNYDTYGLISQCTTERGHERDTLQSRVKVKEQWNAYHKAREANRNTGAVPTSFWFYKELEVTLSGDLTSIVKATVDISVACMPVKSGPSQEEEILDKDVEGNPRQRMTWRSEMHAARSSSLHWRRLASHSCRSLVKRKQERRPLR